MRFGVHESSPKHDDRTHSRSAARHCLGRPLVLKSGGSAATGLVHLRIST
ncbi:hypothetical protein NSU_2723 [Novosphingobium pentaromativorans US6-1]|uniref:Uncharacterized protein n=1 Tax=Novosphingobium pentaromativorans US6-1 TaxID=1088721 RepID=G6EEF3_9SPHN|nr:hypothetical protein NSU_2723 [Novosphingobium pentaromativorans US6-1]